ncbi:hypothetical protein O5165_25260, partial [Escherichia coli]|nr:hypothetical protein [Escherichia coli]
DGKLAWGKLAPALPGSGHGQKERPTDAESVTCYQDVMACDVERFKRFFLKSLVKLKLQTNNAYPGRLKQWSETARHYQSQIQAY